MDKRNPIVSNSKEVQKSLKKSDFLKRNDIVYLYLRMIRCALTEGPTEAKRRYNEYMKNNHPRHAGIKLTREEKKNQKKTQFTTNIIFSIIVPLHNNSGKNITPLIRSLRRQTYRDWELCLMDIGGIEHRKVERICHRMGKRDSRIKYLKLEKNVDMTANNNATINKIMGNFIGILGCDDLLHPSALFETMRAIEEKKADFIYTDEAIFKYKLKDANRFHFKPDFSPDMLRSYNYISQFMAFSRKLLDQVGTGFCLKYDGSQDYDLTLCLTEKAEHIVHIPKVLYFRRDHSGPVASDISIKTYNIESGRKAIADHLRRVQLAGEVLDSSFPTTYRIRYEIEGNPRVSIVIPNKDHIDDLRKCIDSIREKTSWENWEVIIVENNSEEEKTFRYYKDIISQDSRIHVVYWKEGFNFSAISNYGVSFATGDYILLLNNDIEVITHNWIDEMLMFAQRKDVGAVGCMLYYPDDTIQHAGVILGIGIAAGHSHRGYKRGESGYYFRASLVSNMSAVTGACMMIPKHVYEEALGLDEYFQVALNDVDFCMRIRKMGYLIVFTPYAELYHYESKSRGSDETGDGRKRFEAEAARFREKWKKELEQGDPYYNPNLTLDREDFSIKDYTENETV